MWTGYYEFGMGGSTMIACDYAIKSKFKIYSIDSSIEWVNKMKNITCIHNMIADNHADLRLVDIGKTGILIYTELLWYTISKQSWLSSVYIVDVLYIIQVIHYHR